MSGEYADELSKASLEQNLVEQLFKENGVVDQESRRQNELRQEQLANGASRAADRLKD